MTNDNLQEYEIKLGCYKIVFEDENKKTSLNESMDLRHWRILDVYISNVCLALKMTYQNSGAWDCDDAKHELYRALREIWQKALLCDMIRPVVAVVTRLHRGEVLSLEFYKTVSRWSREQDWHRGQFSVYVEAHEGSRMEEDEKAEAILLRLLAHKPQEIGEVKPRTTDEILKEARTNLVNQPERPERGLALRALDALDKALEEAKDERGNDEGVAEYNWTGILDRWLPGEV
ncbi:MAG: hypothetical protein ACFCUJ_09600 [Thiotrichales bacterium]